MTKAQLIEKYGQAWYDEQKAKGRERANKRYHDHPELRQSREYRREVEERWRSKPENAEKKRAESRAYMNAKYAAMSPEERKAWAHDRYLAKRAKMLVDPEYDERERAKAKARHDAWRYANREHVREAHARWVLANPELAKAIAVAAAQNHRLKVNVWSKENKRRRRQAGSIDAKLVLWLKSQPCIDCNIMGEIEVGHIIPIKLGGTNDPDNLIPQCTHCNRTLSSRPHRLAEKVQNG